MIEWRQRFQRLGAALRIICPGWGLVCGLVVLGAGQLVAAEPGPTAVDLTVLKEQIKRDVLAELCQQLGDSAQEVNRAHERLKQEIKREILQELQQQGLIRSVTPAAEPEPPPTGPAPARPTAPAVATPPVASTTPIVSAEPGTQAVAATEHPQAAQESAMQFGDAKGRVLQNGKPLPKCKVRLVRLETSSFLLIRSVKYGIEFETVTDQDGLYLFHHIPVGEYKLKWLTPDATSWVRRIRDKPDVTVTRDETSVLKDVETGIAPVGEVSGS